MIEAILLLLSLILMATTVFPNIDVTEFALIGGAVMAVGLLVFGAVALTARQTRAPARPRSTSGPDDPQGGNGRCRRSRCWQRPK